ncbi:MKI67 FHA domain-interacting nucleolar phosphoprotein-like [Galleria mellonella]|uniref:MKI67 FHA domain-interacting nucleolar phosphoprotein-like n=1 Tax=Galleria mellonella TaxID=7137 RepID=A0A6J1WUP7_GALME|nr:MKI67 FHA domain-interacting nucleolar phosphoprotein-like [Galleria mellonella]
MEENVALDSTKQKQFVKSIKGIKKLIKKDQKGPNLVINNKKPRDVKKKKEADRGLVYLAHIPHGFYEHQMTEYFKQFGQVTNVRVIRSKRTGNSKGYAFVEFKEPSVAEIVAETMNNYLMGKRLIKAVYIPPEKQRKAIRKKWNRVNNPGNEARLKNKKVYNENRDESGELKRAKKLLANLTRTKKKLAELGLNYDFFKPVDVPEQLSSQIEIKEEKDTDIKEEKDVDIKEEKTKLKNKKKVLKQEEEVKGKDLKNKRKTNNLAVKVVDKSVKDVKTKGKQNVQVIVDKKQQKQKQDKLKEAGVKPAEDFMKLEEESNDSDSSYVFDSDEYEKVMQNEDEFNSNLSSEGDRSENDDGDSESSEEVVHNTSKVQKGPTSTKVQKQVNQAIKSKQSNSGKRKAVESSAKKEDVPAGKKSKFEKQNIKKITKKQFKKKK